MQGMETAYVGNGVSAENASTTVGTAVIKAVVQKYQTNNQIGKATIEIEGFGTIENVTGDATVTVYTTDFEIIGTITLEDGVLTWGEIEPNVPRIILTAENSTTLAPGETVQLSAEFRKMSETTLNWTASTTSNISVATVNSNGLVTVDSNAEDGQTATITAEGNGVTSNSITIIVQDISSIAEYRTLTQNSSTGAIVVKANANKTLYDDNNKPVIIPAGFGIASDSGTKIEEGIVIEDAFSSGDNAVKKGSQFVWVPVGQTLNIGNTTATIALSRYDFGIRENDDSVSTLIQAGAQTEILGLGSMYFAEDKTFFTGSNGKYQSSVARKDSNGEIEFISKTNNAKGFYIGRYEMGTNSDKAVCKAGETTWTNIVRGDTTTGAVYQAREMYGYQEGKYASDLLNSYAWDTAIAFIEKCGTESNSSNYAFQIRTRTSKTTTGYTINNKDEQCKIFDMAGNVREWTTESSNDPSFHYVCRGGRYDDGDNRYTSARGNVSTSGSSDGLGFRPILYIL